jgi:hypothetical protein
LKFSAAVGGDVLGSKFDLQKTVARGAKIGFTQSHLEWPPCRVVWSVSQTALSPATAGHFKFLRHQFHLQPKFIVGLGLTGSGESQTEEEYAYGEKYPIC